MNAKYIFENITKDSEGIFNYLSSVEINKISSMEMEDFYYELKSRMISFNVTEGNVFDVCGTGGSGKTRVNLSTILALRLKDKFSIAKHAGRASSGKVGSIDILEKMNQKIAQSPIEAINSIKTNNIAFLSSGCFHPNMPEIALIRKKIKKPTIFNFIMPLLNPISNLCGQMTGSSNARMMKVMSYLALKLKKNIIFVHDVDNGLDDVSITGKTMIIEVLNGNINEYILTPEELEMNRVNDFSLIAGSNNDVDNFKLAIEILSNKADDSYLRFLKINELVASNFFNKCI